MIPTAITQGTLNTLGQKLRLVIGGGTSHRPQMPDTLRDAPQKEGPKAEDAVQVRRLETAPSLRCDCGTSGAKLLPVLKS
jgi:hypothetical protein